MALLKSDNVTGRLPTPSIMDTSGTIHRVEYTFGAAFTTADVLALAKIPPDAVIVDWALDSDDIDSNGTPAAAWKLGILNAAQTDLDVGVNIFKTGILSGQAGVLQRMDNANAMRAGSSAVERTVGLIPTANAATWAGNGLKVGLTLYLAPPKP